MSRWTAMVSVLALAMTACSSHNGDADAGASQVVATVNGTELTAAQFDTRVKQLPAAADARSPAIQQQVLRSFIDETLLAQTATKEGYDKRPAIARELDYARNTILARAYLDQKVPAASVSQTELQAFYASHPYLYAQRRAYRLTDLSLPTNLPSAAPVVAAMQQKGATLETVLAAAQANGVQLRPQVGQTLSDVMPEPLARGLAPRSVGDTVSYNLLGQAHFTRVDAAVDAPMSFVQAQGSLEDRLKEEKRGAAISKKIDELRKVAKIDLGGLGKKISTGTAQPHTSRPKAPAANQQQVIEKGASGI
jgi:EpsD family peptidyl-prolyl cis-trans isomerase